MKINNVERVDKTLSIAILGASNNKTRYSNILLNKLKNENCKIYLINPSCNKIDNIKVYDSLSSLPESVDIISVYLNPLHVSSIKNELLLSNASKIIFNPGSENSKIINELRENGLNVLEACTLVLNSTKQLF